MAFNTSLFAQQQLIKADVSACPYCLLAQAPARKARTCVSVSSSLHMNTTHKLILYIHIWILVCMYVFVGKYHNLRCEISTLCWLRLQTCEFCLNIQELANKWEALISLKEIHMCVHNIIYVVVVNICVNSCR